MTKVIRMVRSGVYEKTSSPDEPQSAMAVERRRFLIEAHFLESNAFELEGFPSSRGRLCCPGRQVRASSETLPHGSSDRQNGRPSDVMGLSRTVFDFANFAESLRASPCLAQLKVRKNLWACSG